MYYFDHMMVLNSTPYYYPPFEPHIGCYYPAMEPLSPPSPNSIQSDSDNSLSSVEVPSTPRKIQEISPTIRCCWRSCGLDFDSLNQLASHVTRVHASSGPDGLFYCGWDGCTRDNKGFNARYKMLVHVRTHTNEKPHQCPECSKSFSRAENLKIHSRSHSGEKPYVCHIPGCNKAYSNSSDRFKHIRTHQVEKPYQCKVQGCMKRYTDPSSLRKHVKTYKHFLIDNNNKDNEKSRIQTQDASTTSREDECDYGYCHQRQQHRLENSSRIIRVETLINFSKDEHYWNHLIEREPSSAVYASSQQATYNFSCCNNNSERDNIDNDMPLDLSISRI